MTNPLSAFLQQWHNPSMFYNASTYQEIINYELQRRVELNPLFSANSFSKKLGISQSYLSLIISGKRALSEARALHLAEMLKFDSDQKEYFLLTVKKSSAKEKKVSEYYEKKIKEFKKKRQVDQLSLRVFDFISDWHYSALLECLNLSDTEPTASAFAAKLRIDEKTASAGLALMETLGLVIKKGQHWKRKVGGQIFTPNEIKSEGLRKFHNQILKHAAAALENQKIEERNISGITMAIDPSKIPEAKQRIQQFMDELMVFLEDGKRSEIYQLSTILINLKQPELL